MKMIVTVSSVGLLVYIRAFLTNLIWGYLFRSASEEVNTKCHICGKSLVKRRFELCIDRPGLGYESEYDKFLCVEHAIQTLLKYREADK
ncbi:MAG: hypothetical protein [Asgard archaea virus VerdaV3]|nr:MAG: hypothetical protein [Asgard archaea virus VerdaV3]